MLGPFQIDVIQLDVSCMYMYTFKQQIELSGSQLSGSALVRWQINLQYPTFQQQQKKNTSNKKIWFRIENVNRTLLRQINATWTVLHEDVDNVHFEELKSLKKKSMKYGQY